MAASYARGGEICSKGNQKASVEEVLAAVKFAANNNIRLSILNSGHDFQ
jgi:hypothetical protein